MSQIPEDIKAALKRSYLDIDHVTIVGYIEDLYKEIKDLKADIKELTGQRMHDEDLAPDKYIGPSHPDGEPSGPYIS